MITWCFVSIGASIPMMHNIVWVSLHDIVLLIHIMISMVVGIPMRMVGTKRFSARAITRWGNGACVSGPAAVAVDPAVAV